MELRILDDLELRAARVFLRSDLNVPLDSGAIADDFRIRQSLATVREVLDRGATRVAVCSHLGRPGGKPDPGLSLNPVAARMSELLAMDVPLCATPSGPIPAGARVALLENVRFEARETSNDIGFARELAALADAYVDDAFGAVHRAHASVAALATLLPNAAGRLLQREVEVLGRLRDAPEHPYVAVLGGAKVSDKLAVIESVLRVADTVVIGGAMCFTFLRAQGLSTGRSLVEEDMIATCSALLDANADRLVLPVDFVVAPRMGQGAGAREVPADSIPDDEAGFDIGTLSRRAAVDVIRGARTVMWNGPMGVAEIDDFAAGTRAVAAAVAKGSAYSVVGGGDSIAALETFGYARDVDHASTGGGAMLEFLEGLDLPGLEPLMMS